MVFPSLSAQKHSWDESIKHITASTWNWSKTSGYEEYIFWKETARSYACLLTSSIRELPKAAPKKEKVFCFFFLLVSWAFIKDPVMRCRIFQHLLERLLQNHLMAFVERHEVQIQICNNPAVAVTRIHFSYHCQPARSVQVIRTQITMFSDMWDFMSSLPISSSVGSITVKCVA